jgi:hypothetical protein
VSSKDCPLSPRRSASSDVEGSYEYCEYAIDDGREWVVVKLEGWWVSNPPVNRPACYHSSPFIKLAYWDDQMKTYEPGGGGGGKGHAEGKMTTRYEHKILVEKLEGKICLRGLTRGWDDNIKPVLKDLRRARCGLDSTGLGY